MKPLATHRCKLLLLTLLPLTAMAAPPPYWSPYPPSPYYYPPAPVTMPQPSAPVAETAAGQLQVTEVDAPVIDEPTDTIAATATVNTLGDDHGAPTSEAAPKADTDESRQKQEIAAAIQAGNFAEAYYLWRPRAEAGDADAQYGIGWMYHNGYGLAINDEEAIVWWELASRQGHVDATFALGMLFGLGEGGVTRDMAMAVSYYHQAARAGHDDARLLLRTLIAEGEGSALQLMQILLDEGRQGEIAPAASIIRPKANIRQGPGTTHKVLFTLQAGHILMPLKRDGRWLLVGIKDKKRTGWVHDSLVGQDIFPN